MKVELRIVAGLLRGRKIHCHVGPDLRPTPQMVREALFSILGNAVPGRPFFDLFAGTGVNGLEALSRGASFAHFVERDVRLAHGIDDHMRKFDILAKGQVVRTDVYRWAAQWLPPKEPVNVFISPPFADFQHRIDDLKRLVASMQQKAANGSVVVVQSEKQNSDEQMPEPGTWDLRHYGRNVLLIWVKEMSIDEHGKENEPSVIQ